jgi:nitroreductase
MLKELVTRNRSYRRFFQDTPISRETLLEMVELARLSASGGNNQPLKFAISWEPEKNARIFPTMSWARLLEGWGGPKEGERPTAYIIILHDKQVSPTYFCDQGIAAQSILLGAAEKGLGGCMIASFKKDELRKILDLPDRYDILLAIALGKPREKVVIETVGSDGSTRYWRDAQDIHHVPKRALKDLVIG